MTKWTDWLPGHVKDKFKAESYCDVAVDVTGDTTDITTLLPERKFDPNFDVAMLRAKVQGFEEYVEILLARIQELEDYIDSKELPQKRASCSF